MQTASLGRRCPAGLQRHTSPRDGAHKRARRSYRCWRCYRWIAYTSGVSAAHEPVTPGAVHFYERVYALVARVPAGRVTTYGDLALALGWPRHARLVGYALARCPDDLPAHRVGS